MSELFHRVASQLSETYTLERELGGGGMSRVFVADETALGRKVVVKVLSPELGEAISAERFVREIKVAARLQQANIVPVLRAGAIDGLPYYTMPLVTGESLRSRITGAPLPLTEALGVLRDVAKALAYAHAQGVVHRDIKPENVLLSSGTAVVTDFGIAKAISASRQDAESHTTALTSVGTSLGTPAYMSPEQAAGDPATDARTDLYAWGVMAYELLAGQHPMARHRSAHAMIRAHIVEMPTPLADCAPALPSALAALVMQCLAKSPSDRPASAAELVTALDGVQVTGGHSVAPKTPAGVLRAFAVYSAGAAAVALSAKAAITVIGLPTWVLPGALGVMIVGLPVVLITALLERQRSLHHTTTPGSMGTVARLAVQHPRRFTWRRTLAGGGIALIAFAAAVAGFMTMRQLGIGPFGTLIGSKALAAEDRLVIADMRGPVSDSGLGAVFAEGLRAGLSESKALRLVSADRVAMLLGQMQRPGAPLVDSVAREVAERAGAKAILDGEVRMIGASYAMTVRLLPVKGGEPLITLQEAATHDADFTAATGRLAKRLRERVGESLRSVNASPELEDVTTSSLMALRRYTEAQKAARAGDYLGSLRLIQEAFTIDSGFASAYRFAGSLTGGLLGIRQTQSALAARAYAMRARATPFERATIEATYWSDGPSPDFAKELEAAERAYAIDPYRGALLASQAAFHQRAYDRAARLAQEARAADPSNLDAAVRLILAQGELGLMDSVQAGVKVLAREHPTHPMSLAFQVMLLTMLGEDSVATQIAQRMERVTEVPLLVEWGAALHKGVAGRGGRLREAATAYALQERVGFARGARAYAGSTAFQVAIDRSLFLGDVQGARQLLDSADAAFPQDSVPPLERYSDDYLLATKWAGRTDRLREVLEWMRRNDPNRRTIDDAPWVPELEGIIASAEGRHADALAAFRRSDVGGGRRRKLLLLAMVYDDLGEADSARVHYERFVTGTSLDFSLWTDARFLARAHRRLGELYQERGELAKAHGQYAALVRLWRNADPELQPAIRDVRAQMAVLEPRLR
jgi:eukaryotic-like serine/threonine-protein kinase